jgi:hypothetical protein
MCEVVVVEQVDLKSRFIQQDPVISRDLAAGRHQGCLEPLKESDDVGRLLVQDRKRKLNARSKLGQGDQGERHPTRWPLDFGSLMQRASDPSRVAFDQTFGGTAAGLLRTERQPSLSNLQPSRSIC